MGSERNSTMNPIIATAFLPLVILETSSNGPGCAPAKEKKMSNIAKGRKNELISPKTRIKIKEIVEALSCPLGPNAALDMCPPSN